MGCEVMYMKSMKKISSSNNQNSNKNKYFAKHKAQIGKTWTLFKRDTVLDIFETQFQLKVKVY